MATPKYKEDFKTANLLIARLTPYLSGEQPFSLFIKRRIKSQIDEITDSHLRDATYMYFLFSDDEIDQATALAEQLLAQHPSDEVTWGNYACCLAYKVSYAAALNASLRGFEYTKSPRFLEHSLLCANLIADYDVVLSSAATLARMEKLSMTISKEHDLATILENAKLAKDSGRLELITAIGRLMERLTGVPGGQEAVLLSPPFDPDDDSDSYLLEMGYTVLSAAECTELNIKLIDERIKANLDDWRVLGSFYHMDKVLTQDGGNTQRFS